MFGPNIGLVVLFSILPVLVLMVVQVRRGGWGGRGCISPARATVLYTVGITGMAGLVFYLVKRQPDSFLLQGSATALLFLICAVTTRWSKVSLHVAAAALTATTLILIGSPVGWMVAGVIPILIWSRLKLRRHTSFELVLGLIFGIAAGVAMHWFQPYRSGFGRRDSSDGYNPTALSPLRERENRIAPSYIFKLLGFPCHGKQWVNG